MPGKDTFTLGDMVICQRGSGKTMAGGFEIKSMLMPNTEQSGGGVISKLAVPAGLMFAQKTMENYVEEDKGVIDEKVFDSLFNAAELQKPKKNTSTRKTRRKKQTKLSKRTTRKRNN